MAYQDFREWVKKLEDEEELRRITAEVDWNLEIGAIIRKVSNMEGPAVLFENIKDCKDTRCTKLISNTLGTRSRVAMALGLPKETTFKEMTRYFKEKFNNPLPPVPPELTKTAPVKENIIKGEDIDLTQFPIPKLHYRDGGRYINTACGVVTRDPDTRQLNIGTYRGMISGKNKIPVLLNIVQHWGHHFVKYRNRGEKMPVAVVYGWDPALLIVASIPLPHHGFSEYDATGALRGEPVPLVKCETVDLEVPATAEIVIEGYISADPKTFVMEGPFGEYPGYFGGLASPKPTIEVTCITHRNDPIYRSCLAGNSPGSVCESGIYSTPGFSAVAWNYLELAGVPGILDVWSAPVVCNTNTRVQIKKFYRSHAKQIANVLWSIGAGMSKHVIVVDDDIDIHDNDALDWAIAYRVNAAMGGVVLLPDSGGSVLDPSTPLKQRDPLKYGEGKWCRMLIDATKNWDLEREAQYEGDIYPPSATDISPEMEKVMERRWKEYGL